MAEKFEVKVSHQFKASAQRVYDAWLEPDKVRVWMSTALRGMGLTGEIVQIEIDPKVGGSFLFTDMRDGTETRHWGTYLELESPHRIAFTWIFDPSEESDPSQVVLTIEPEDEGCIANIVHKLDVKWSDYVAQCENGWSCMLLGMDAFLET